MRHHRNKSIPPHGQNVDGIRVGQLPTHEQGRRTLIAEAVSHRPRRSSQVVQPQRWDAGTVTEAAERADKDVGVGRTLPRRKQAGSATGDHRTKLGPDRYLTVHPRLATRSGEVHAGQISTDQASHFIGTDGEVKTQHHHQPLTVCGVAEQPADLLGGERHAADLLASHLPLRDEYDVIHFPADFELRSSPFGESATVDQVLLTSGGTEAVKLGTEPGDVGRADVGQIRFAVDGTEQANAGIDVIGDGATVELGVSLVQDKGVDGGNETTAGTGSFGGEELGKVLLKELVRVGWGRTAFERHDPTRLAAFAEPLKPATTRLGEAVTGGGSGHKVMRDVMRDLSSRDSTLVFRRIPDTVQGISNPPVAGSIPAGCICDFPRKVAVFGEFRGCIDPTFTPPLPPVYPRKPSISGVGRYAPRYAPVTGGGL
jgi:hypothetical protein